MSPVLDYDVEDAPLREKARDALDAMEEAAGRLPDELGQEIGDTLSTFARTLMEDVRQTVAEASGGGDTTKALLLGFALGAGTVLLSAVVVAAIIRLT